ncbi:MAG: hypothetical protein J7503_15855, partial [Cellulomonas iranensis]|uniref:hypothetical protein n=1 Tax=Cellulomonas iranensis TaxID=76862 RepID=UPI001B1ABEDA
MHLTALLPVVVLVALLAALVAALAPRRQPATDLTDVVTSPAAHARARRHAGAVAAIAELQREADVVVLTNLGDRYQAPRIAQLREHGIEVPVFT